MNQPQDGSTSPASPERPSSLTDRVRSLRLPERTAPPLRRFSWLPWALCLFLAGTTMVFALRPPDDGDEGRKSKGKPAQTENKGDVVLEAKGYIVPVRQIQVSPKVTGMVFKLLIKEDDRVEVNQILAELEDVDYKADRDRARYVVEELEKYREQEIEQLEADVKDNEVQRERHKKNWTRLEELKKSKGVSEQEYEDAEMNYKSAVHRVRRSQIALDLMKNEGPRDARLSQAKAELAKAEWRLQNCKVRAPITGTILTKKTEEGAMVNPSAFSNGVAASICDMANLRDLEVDLAVAERDIHKVFEKQPCKIKSEAYPARVYEGHVSRVMPTADRSKGAVPVRVQITLPAEEKEGQYLRPEMGAIVTFLKK